MARADPGRVRLAQLIGCASRVAAILGRDTARTDRLRAQWPELGEALDDLTELGTTTEVL